MRLTLKIIMDTKQRKEKKGPKGPKGPKGHRAFVMILTILLGLLIYWFLGFLLDDISDQPGPSLQEIQKKYQDPSLIKNKETSNEKMNKLIIILEEQQQQQTILQTSINSYRDTMDQLLDLQKASIQKGIPFAAAAQKNVQQITNLYLDYQKQFQDLNNSITKNNLEKQQLQNQINAIDNQLEKQNKLAYKEYNVQLIKHNWTIAGSQLLILIPLLLITTFLIKTYKTNLYQPMFIAIGIAIFCKIALVMHDYFPSYIFKYLLILALIYITSVTLIAKLKMFVTPKPSWLQKQYREAYQKTQCPLCQFPIKPGISKFFTVKQQGNNSPLTYSSYLDKIDTYTCPGCGELLFEQCTHCSSVRYSLLKYCDFCGIEKENIKT